MKRLWSQRNGREKFLIVACLIAAVVAVPMLMTPPDSGSAKLMPASRARAEYASQVAAKERMQAEIEKIRPKIKKLVYTETPEKVLPRIIQQLQAQAKKAGIHIREIKPLRARRLATLTKVPVSVRFASRFDQSIPFIYSIEDPTNRMVVEKFSISSPDSKSKTVDVEIQMALFTNNPSEPEAG